MESGRSLIWKWQNNEVADRRYVLAKIWFPYDHNTERTSYMSAENVREYLKGKGLEGRITVHKGTIDTVEHAAQQVGCSEGEIAKTLSFVVDGKPVLVVMSGDMRISNPKFKSQFHAKPSMIPYDRVDEMIGQKPGGVCPFAVKEGVSVYLDVSMKRFEIVHPAAGSEFTSVSLTLHELESACGAAGWCDVCK